MPGFHCATCGDYHQDLPMTFGALAPAAWYALPEGEREQRAQLSSDQCVIDDSLYFLLGRLEIPVIDGDEPFTWLTWVCVSEADFERVSALWESPGRETEPPCAATVQSALPYPDGTLDLRATLHTQPVGERPCVFLDDASSLLGAEQQNGITLAQVQAMAEMALHGH
ncbi:DUF2199 domain-containing protein [Pseudomonas sp. X10]